MLFKRRDDSRTLRFALRRRRRMYTMQAAIQEKLILLCIDLGEYETGRLKHAGQGIRERGHRQTSSATSSPYDLL